MKILIRGAGDLATGIASRLYGAGHQILMTEIREPLTVRRTVAFSRAVCQGRAQVEDMTAVLAADRKAAEQILADGDIAVMVDEEASCRNWYEPDVLIDAILAKRNVGTRITDAPLVVGVGPGFTAGGGLQLCGRDETGPYAGQCDPPRQRHPEHRRAGKCRRLHY